MLSKPLLATLLAAVWSVAPSGLWAFEAMDCIGTEFCDGDSCTPSLMVFPLEFDWATDSLTVDMGGGTIRMTLLTPELSSDGMSGEVRYDGPDDMILSLSFAGEDTSMDLSNGVPGQRHLAVCAAREAA